MAHEQDPRQQSELKSLHHLKDIARERYAERKFAAVASKCGALVFGAGAVAESVVAASTQSAEWTVGSVAALAGAGLLYAYNKSAERLVMPAQLDYSNANRKIDRFLGLNHELNQ